MMDKLKTVDIKVWLRVVVFGILALATVLAGAEIIPEVPTEEAVTLGVTGGLAIVTAIYNAWKNNDFTAAAQIAGKILVILKDNGGELTDEAIEEIKELQSARTKDTKVGGTDD